MQVMRLQIELLPNEVLRASASSFQYLREVVMDYLLLGLVFGYPPLIVHDAVDVVFSPPHIDSTVKELGVGIPVPQVDNPSTLIFSCPLEHSQANHPALEPRA